MPCRRGDRHHPEMGVAGKLQYDELSPVNSVCFLPVFLSICTRCTYCMPAARCTHCCFLLATPTAVIAATAATARAASLSRCSLHCCPLFPLSVRTSCSFQRLSLVVAPPRDSHTSNPTDSRCGVCATGDGAPPPDEACILTEQQWTAV